MKQITITINADKCIMNMMQETANTAARAELMGISGVYDVMTLNDEEIVMVKEWMDHSMSDLYLLASKKMRDSFRTLQYIIQGYMPDNFDKGLESVITDYANKYMLDELMVKWMRWCESSSTMKGVTSPLGKEWSKVRDADWELLNSALNMRKRPYRTYNENTEEQICEEPESNIVED